MRVCIPAAAAGIALTVALMALGQGLQALAFPEGNGPVPTWYAVASSMLEPTQGLLPGVVAGWLARQGGLIHGAIVALGSTLSSLLLVAVLFGALPLGTAAIGLIAGLLTNVLTQCIGAVAGVALRTRGAAI
jgi:sorbitol-specific phosphotransferase system component IIC